MSSQYTIFALWAVTLLLFLVPVPVADALLTMSPPNSNRCPARSALLDPSNMVSSSSSTTNTESEISTSGPEQLSTIPRFDQGDTSASKTPNVCRNLHQKQKQGIVVSLLTQLWSTVLDNIESSKSIPTDDLLLEVGDWQAYQCMAKRDSKYSYASGHVYYFNSRTGASQWEKPYADFPTPKVARTDPLGFWTQGRSFTAPLAFSTTALWAASKMDDESSSRRQQSWWNTWVQVQKSVSDAFSSGGTDSNTPAQQSTDASTTKPWWSFLLDSDNKGPRANDNIGSDVGTFSSKTKPNTSNWWPFSFWGEADSKTQRTEQVEKRNEAVSSASSATPWDALFREDKKVPQAYFESDKGDLIPGKESDGAVEHYQHQQHSPRYTDWVENLSLYLTKDTSRTRTLFSVKNVPVVGPILASEKEKVSSASDSAVKNTPAVAFTSAATAAAIQESREQALQEKRYAASVARQANLRKNYDDVVMDRSPTISLTAMKKSHKPLVRKTWFRYLED